MSTGTRIALARADAIAQRITDALGPSCRRIEVAGSIRRRRPDIGDIDVVAVPAMANLFDDYDIPGVSALDNTLRELSAAGKLLPIATRGDRMKTFELPGRDGMRLNVFIVRPDQWGVALAVRTGPREFAKALVTQRNHGGRLADGLRIHDWRVWPPGTYICGMMDAANYRGPFFEPTGRPLDTPEERDFLDSCAGGYLPPEQRDDPPEVPPPMTPMDTDPIGEHPCPIGGNNSGANDDDRRRDRTGVGGDRPGVGADHGVETLLTAAAHVAKSEAHHRDTEAQSIGGSRR